MLQIGKMGEVWLQTMRCVYALLFVAETGTNMLIELRKNRIASPIRVHTCWKIG